MVMAEHVKHDERETGAGAIHYALSLPEATKNSKEWNTNDPNWIVQRGYFRWKFFLLATTD